MRIWRVTPKGMQKAAEKHSLGDLLARPTLGEEGRILAQYYLFLCEESMSSSDDQDHVDLPQSFLGVPNFGKTDCQGSIRSSLGGELVWHAMCKEILPCQAGRGGSMKECYTRGEPVGEIELPSL